MLMADINCPYNALDLKIAALSLDKLDLEGLSDGLLEMHEKEFVPPGADPEKVSGVDYAAYHHNISKKDLLDSPNYAALMSEFQRARINSILQYMQSKTDDDKVAWLLTMMVCDPVYTSTLLEKGNVFKGL